MTFTEERMNLFNVADDYVFAHCISADFALGAGIAREFNKRFDTRKQLREQYRYAKGVCFKTDRVYNLVTKDYYWEKPTLASMHCALTQLRNAVVKDNVKKLAMPKIGCGLDRLSWSLVSEMIKMVFQDTDVDVLICYL